MSYKEIETRSEGELCLKLREVTLRGSDKQPYLNSAISIEMFDPDTLSPVQRYVLDSELKKVEGLRWAILDSDNIDILSLKGYIKCKYEDQEIDILPVVCEEYIDYRGQIHVLIADGLHRTFLAYQMGYPINVVYVRNINKFWPYYSYPLPRGFKDVEIVSSIPEGYIKKFHVSPRHKALYRNYNSMFSNIGDSRPYDKK